MERKRSTRNARAVRPAALQARSLRRTRRDRANETAEDYVEAIADLSASQGEARVVDLARRLGVSHVTVNRTVARLQRNGLVSAQPYRAIFLTSAGRRLANESRRKHETIVRFLESLGVPDDVALMDAEGIEHHVSAKTLAAIVRWLDRHD